MAEGRLNASRVGHGRYDAGARHERLSRDEWIVAGLGALFALCLVLGGGSARGDALGQVVVRLGAAVTLAGLLMIGPGLDWRARWPLPALLGGLIALMIAQVVPLPPELWRNLGGRATIAAQAGAAGIELGWRPLSLVPDATLDSLFAMIVPAAALAWVAAAPRRWLQALPEALVALAAISAVVAVGQQLEVGSAAVLLDRGTDIGGVLANRNHQALVLSIGLLMLPLVALRTGIDLRAGRLWVGFGIFVLIVLMIIAGGARVGLLLAPVALALGLALAWSNRALAGRRRLLLVVALVAVALVGAILAVVLADGRAASLDRLVQTNADSELRVRALPVVTQLIGDYWPLGSGIGTFDIAFMRVEPDALINPLYYNHAHSDPLEWLIEAGAVGAIGLALLVAFLIARLWTTWRFSDSAQRGAFAVLPLIAIASLSDYPLRTPLVAVIAIVSLWMATGPVEPRERR